MSAPAIPRSIARGNQRDESNNILTPGLQDNRSITHNEAKLTRQINALKQHFGFGTVFGLVAVFISIATPIAIQSRTNGENGTAIKNIDEKQSTSQKVMLDGFAGIQSTLARIGEQQGRIQEEQNRQRDDMKTERLSREAAMVDLRVRVDSASLDMGIIKAKLAAIEARQQERKP